MDPITSSILAALAKLGEPAVKDAYEGVKKLLARKFGEVKEALDSVEKAPDSKGRRTVLEEEVEKSTAANDQELLAAVKSLAEAVGKQSGGGGTSVTQTVQGDRNIFSGFGSVNVHEK